MTTLIKKVVAKATEPTMLVYDPKDEKQSKAFLALLLDFYDETEVDDEIQKRFESPHVRLLKVRNDYVGFLVFKYLEEGATVYVTTFGIHSSARGKGYGKILLSSFIAECRKDPTHKRMGLAVREDNTPAVRLYAKLGFRVIRKGKEGEIVFEVRELKL